MTSFRLVFSGDFVSSPCRGCREIVLTPHLGHTAQQSGGSGRWAALRIAGAGRCRRRRSASGSTRRATQPTGHLGRGWPRTVGAPSACQPLDPAARSPRSETALAGGCARSRDWSAAARPTPRWRSGLARLACAAYAPAGAAGSVAPRVAPAPTSRPPACVWAPRGGPVPSPRRPSLRSGSRHPTGVLGWSWRWPAGRACGAGGRPACGPARWS